MNVTDTSPTVLALPFRGRWLVRNSPARRVPSHGTDLLAQRFAIDFVGVDDRRRTARDRDWRSLLATEPPERFFAFGRPILAPAAGVVLATHDGEQDHEARRSQLALVPYALGQAGRLRQGVDAVAGNSVIIQMRGLALCVAIVHLRMGSLRIGVGDQVAVGQQIAECGNSGNSTQPHVHVQVMDSPDLAVAHGVPMQFRDYREWPRRGHARRQRVSIAERSPGSGASPVKTVPSRRTPGEATASEHRRPEGPRSGASAKPSNQTPFIDVASGVPAEGSVVAPLPAG